ncbi:CHAT domain-containing protein [Streptomyces sp. NPDC046727]|uniref:CHAT domain-containing protein n=1 Tax=Streptomyces sp. NPDC046727 TaxID=3155373 RepID=UPI0033EA19A9
MPSSPRVRRLAAERRLLVLLSRFGSRRREAIRLASAGLLSLALYQVSGRPDDLLKAAALYDEALGPARRHGPPGAAAAYASNLLAAAVLLQDEHGDGRLLGAAVDAAGPVAAAGPREPADTWRSLLDNYGIACDRLRTSAESAAQGREDTEVGASAHAFTVATARFERLLDAYRADGDTEVLDRAEQLVAAAFATDRSSLVPYEQLLIAAHNGAAVQQEVHRRQGRAVALRRGVELLRPLLALPQPLPLGRPSEDLNVHDAVRATLAHLDLTLYEAAGDPSALDESVALLDARVADDHARLLVRERTDLGAALRTRYELTGSADDLRRSADVMTGVPLADVAADLRAGFEVNRATTLAAIARRDRSVPGLVAAADGYRRALEAIGGADDTLRATAEGNLGTALSDLYRLTGDDRVAEHATTAMTNAVSLTPRHGGALPKYLSNLGNHLIDVAEARGDGGLLAAGVDACRRATELVSPDNRFRTRYLDNALHALAALYNRTREDWIVAYALRGAREIVSATTDRTHPDLPGHLLSYATWLAHAARAAADADLHDEAVRAAEEAVSLRRERGEDAADALMSLGRILSGWRQTSAEGAEPDAGALAALRAGLDATPADDRRYAGRARALAALLARAGDSGPDEAERLLHTAHQARTAPLADRIEAARDLARLLERTGRFADALDVYESALDLLELMVGPAIARRDGQAILARHGTLGADAAACALQLDDPVRALSCAEHGKAVLLTQTLALASDLSLLRQAAPELAERFTHVADRMRVAGVLGSAADADPAPTTSVPLAGSQVRLAVDDFRAVVTEIRGLPDLGDFLRGPRIGELLTAGAYGPVVVANVTGSRADLIVVRASGIAHVPLPDASWADLGRVTIAVSEALDADDGSDAALQVLEDRVADCSQWLWRAVCAPLIDALGLSPGTDGRSPDLRIWWCVSEFLAYLPVHAAAPDPSGASMLDYAVSSFVPSVGALLAGRRRAGRAAGEVRSVLGVAMRTTPGFDELTAADAEIDAIAHLWPHRTVLLHGAEATSAAVTTALRSHHLAHFACHAAMSHDDPFSARLVLSDDATSPLTIWRLVDSGAAGAGELAYLSACRTARPSIALPAESLHIASAFYAAGFNQVIGNLWPVEDEVSLRGSRTVYARLTESADADSLPGAEAVNAWGRAQRGRDPHTITRYASMIHTGM